MGHKMGIKKLSVRSVRKLSIVGNYYLRKVSNLATRVEGKATKILDGVDGSIRIEKTVQFEKVYYNANPFITPIQPAMPAIGSSPTITLFIPSLDGASFFGGTATALVASALLAKKMNRKLRIVQTLKTGNPGSLSFFFKREGIDFSDDNIKVISVTDRAYNKYGYISMHPEDIFIASAWWDAYLLNKLPLSQKFIYLVQDFEPIFYNNSDLYVMAEETYKYDSFIPLCNTELMLDFMKERSYRAFSKGYFFEPAVSRNTTGKITSITTDKAAKRKMFLYGRPNVHRNLFFTAVGSINTAIQSRYIKPSEWEFFMAGQDNLPDIQLSAGVTIKNLGKMSMSEYIEFCKTVDVAISPMMAPHPNYPTLEFASTGAMVVTTRYANKQNLDRYSKNIIMADTSLDSLAGAINIAVNTDKKTRQKNLTGSNISSSWHTSLNTTLGEISSLFKDS